MAARSSSPAAAGSRSLTLMYRPGSKARVVHANARSEPGIVHLPTLLNYMRNYRVPKKKVLV